MGRQNWWRNVLTVLAQRIDRMGGRAAPAKYWPSAAGIPLMALAALAARGCDLDVRCVCASHRGLCAGRVSSCGAEIVAKWCARALMVRRVNASHAVVVKIWQGRNGRARAVRQLHNASDAVRKQGHFA